MGLFLCCRHRTWCERSNPFSVLYKDLSCSVVLPCLPCLGTGYKMSFMYFIHTACRVYSAVRCWGEIWWNLREYGPRWGCLVPLRYLVFSPKHEGEDLNVSTRVFGLFFQEVKQVISSIWIHMCFISLPYIRLKGIMCLGVHSSSHVPSA